VEFRDQERAQKIDAIIENLVQVEADPQFQGRLKELKDEVTAYRQTRSQESIKEVIKSHRGSLDFAYRKALRSDPTLKGIINIEFTVSPDGSVISARIVSSTISDPSFEEDVLKRVKTWKFPAYPDSGNTVVTYPIEFTPV